MTYEGKIRFMPLVWRCQCHHCLPRHHGVRTRWSRTGEGQASLREQMEALRVE